ncbi:MAG TPA: CHAT domain-containing protein, partial [Ktedonobacteraceae bacterium]|nr:CHAT domain-containing protein [Ktedonobacteraceae bacterium]
MAILRIREIPGSANGASAANSPNAQVSFDHGEEFPATIQNPFSAAEEKRLAWYFEDYLRFPFTRNVLAEEAAQSINAYGHALFEQVFADRDAYTLYDGYKQSGFNNVQVEIVGSPQFHALHWEALKDPRLPQPLVLSATMVRKNVKPVVIRTTVQPSPTINLLVITARPRGGRDVGYRTISRPLVDSLRQARVPINIDILRPGTYKAFENHLRHISAQHGVGHYHVIHFDMHGAVLPYEALEKQPAANRYQFNDRYARPDLQPYEGVRAFLAFEGEQDDQSDLVEAAELADLLTNHHIPIAILNACQSGMQIGASETSLGSRLMQAGVQLVLAMGYSVTVSAAEQLMQTLYKQLLANDDFSIAIRHGRSELYNHRERRAYFDQKIDLQDWLLPVVYQNQPVRLSVRDFTPEESKAYFEDLAEEARHTAPEPQYGFVGRDLDILSIEKRLLTRRNILLVRGMGGAGKTTLLRHLDAWWRATGFVDKVFYFGYDERAWTRQQILDSIIRRLYGEVTYLRDFQPLSLDAQQYKLAQRLRSERHLLILDNLESITGAHLAIQHTLPETEQKALQRLLSDLSDGQTLILLGSRGGESWLSKGTFEDNIYELPGLDPEAASTLADRILEKYRVTRYRKDANLQKLLKLLDGFPLALEVVLANLAHQQPGEIVEALQAGDVSLDTDESKQQGKDIFEQKTESILRCIDYSNSNLSPDAQQLLLCLAPFTSVIWLDMLENYTNHLKQQPILSTLPFERWPEVLQEAANWGLLSPDADIPRFLHLQPILPYFLRNRLSKPEQAEMRQAIETAFRQHYDQVGDMLYDLLESKEPQERQAGQVLVSLEYENLVTALNLALAAQVSIINYYNALSSYLDATQEQRRGLELGQIVLKLLENYPAEKLSGQLGAEFVGVIDDIAKRQLLLKDYAAAEKSYQKALALILQIEQIDKQLRDKVAAGIYHQLG